MISQTAFLWTTKQRWITAMGNIWQQSVRWCTEGTWDNGCNLYQIESSARDTYTLVLRSLSSKLAFIYWWSPLQDVRHHGTSWNYPLTKSSFITLLCTNILLLDRSVVVLYSYIDSAINTFCCRNYISKQPNICIKGVWFLPSKKKEMRKSVYLTNERFSLFPY